jgi:hypothetical protein
VLDHLLKEIIIYSEDDAQSDKKDAIVADSLYIANHMYNFLQKVGFNNEDLLIAESVFSMADNLVYIENDKDLRKLAENLPKKTKKRYEAYIENMKAAKVAEIKKNQNRNKI